MTLKNIEVHPAVSGEPLDLLSAVDVRFAPKSAFGDLQIRVNLPKSWAIPYRGIRGTFDSAHRTAAFVDSAGETIFAYTGLDAHEVEDRIRQLDSWAPLPPLGWIWDWDDYDSYLSVSRCESDVYVLSTSYSGLRSLKNGENIAELENPGAIRIASLRMRWLNFDLGEYQDAWRYLTSIANNFANPPDRST